MSNKLVTWLVFLLMAVFCIVTCRQNSLLKSQLQDQGKKFSLLSQNAASTQSKSNLGSMNRILTKIEKELQSADSLSYSTIKSIADLSQSLKPYRYLKGDSLSQKKWSPERGQLLLALTNMDIDTSDLLRIFFKVSFANADLAKADLRGAFLRGIDLENANLAEADLRQVNLVEANLMRANLRQANLDYASLRKMNLKRANLEWAELNETDLRNSNLDGANLSNAKIRKSDLRNTRIMWAKLNGVNLENSNLKNGSFFWSDFRKGNLKKVDFSGADIRRTYLAEANLDEANFTNTKLDKVEVATKNWFEKLKNLQVIGLDSIHKKYQINRISDGISDYKLAILKK